MTLDRCSERERKRSGNRSRMITSSFASQGEQSGTTSTQEIQVGWQPALCGFHIGPRLIKCQRQASQVCDQLLYRRILSRQALSNMVQLLTGSLNFKNFGPAQQEEHSFLLPHWQQIDAPCQRS